MRWTTGVVLLAAGSGSRFGSPLPKQFRRLSSVPLFEIPLRVFASLPSVKEIIVVGRSAERARIENSCRRLRRPGLARFVEGGAFRGASVRNGVAALASDLDLVLVHDAARPLVDGAMIRRVEKAALHTGAALAAWPLADTLKMSGARQRVRATLPRAGLWLAQTPQGFRRSVALKCLLRPSRTATDDVQLAERRGYPVEIVEGSQKNIKVTYQHDFNLCRFLVSA